MHGQICAQLHDSSNLSFMVQGMASPLSRPTHGGTESPDATSPDSATPASGALSRGRRVRVRQDQSVVSAGTRIEVLEPAGHPSGGSHTASASESVSAANTRSGEALMTRTAV